MKDSQIPHKPKLIQENYRTLQGYSFYWKDSQIPHKLKIDSGKLSNTTTTQHNPQHQAYKENVKVN